MAVNNRLSEYVIVLLQNYLNTLGVTPVIHFELEGCYQFSQPKNCHHASSSHYSYEKSDKKITLDFELINQRLLALNIDGELIAEYWQNQWEYVSKFNGQTPLKEANNLRLAIDQLPNILAKQGVSKTLIKPVVWSGDQGRLAENSKHIFIDSHRAVHIPNAIQINVSALNQQGENMVSKPFFGECLQQCFMETSLNCALLYLPEEEAFERLALKTRYGLGQELCSPVDISGGHQGSIALYKEIGKHNQLMGVETLLYDQHNKVMLSENNWQKTARIEHRLGASSLHYDPFVNVIFALLNVVDAFDIYLDKACAVEVSPSKTVSLPISLYDTVEDIGAITLFEQDTWFSDSINRIEQKMTMNTGQYIACEKLGDKLKAAILSRYQPAKLLLT